MTDKELKRLSRSELLEMLIAQMEENEKLKICLKKMQEKANNRQIAIDRAGSIAEAAMELNGVFEAAQAVAAQYLENIQRLENEQEIICQRLEASAKAKAEAICAEADTYSQKVRTEADSYSQKVHSDADLYQKRMAGKINALIQEMDGLSSRIGSGEAGGSA